MKMASIAPFLIAGGRSKHHMARECEIQWSGGTPNLVVGNLGSQLQSVGELTWNDTIVRWCSYHTFLGVIYIKFISYWWHHRRYDSSLEAAKGRRQTYECEKIVDSRGGASSISSGDGRLVRHASKLKCGAPIALDPERTKIHDAWYAILLFVTDPSWYHGRFVENWCADVSTFLARDKNFKIVVTSYSFLIATRRDPAAINVCSQRYC